jgi:hypothetical protein
MTRKGSPVTPRGWYCWAHNAREGYERPRSIRLEPSTGGGSPSSRREGALSVIIKFERAVGKENIELMQRYYLGGCSWVDLTGAEKKAVRGASKRFAEALRAAGYLPKRDTGPKGPRG